MDKNVGPISFSDRNNPGSSPPSFVLPSCFSPSSLGYMGKPYSEATAEIVDHEVKKLVDRATETTRNLLLQRKDSPCSPLYLLYLI